MELELRINGVTAEQDVAPNESLLTLLRREGYTSVKRGCTTGACGACTVLVDGIPRPSCVMLAAQAGGCALTTVECLGAPDALHPLQQAFVDLGAAQCGFCTPGKLLSAYALLKETLSPTEEQVRDALSGNVCRCSGYVKPVQAVLRAAAMLRGETVSPVTYAPLMADEEDAHVKHVAGDKVREPVAKKAASVASGSVTTKIPAITSDMMADMAASAAPSAPSVPPTPPLPMSANAKTTTAKVRNAQLQVVGQALPALNATRMVTGQPVFAMDKQPRGMLYARILTSPHAHAVIKNISVQKAQALSGVYTVLTYKDISRIPYSRIERFASETPLVDQYSLDYVVRYVGDRVAAVVAETPEIAEQALRLIDVEYDVLPAVLDLRRVADSAGIRIHPESESQGIHDASRNIAVRVRTEIGDVDQGFASADHIVEAEYVVPAHHHATVEPEAVLTYFDEKDVLVVRTNSQQPHYVRRTLAQLLHLPLRRIRVEMPETSGSGSRQALGFEDVCALLTISTRRPVQLALTQTESLHSSSTNQAHIVRLKTGVKSDGTIVANQMILLVDTGAYATHALTNQQLGCSSLALYPVPNMRYVAEVVYTNHAPSAAHHGYELLPEIFALESHIDDIARKIGMDALAFRRKNQLRASDSLASCLKVVEEKIQWKEKRGKIKSDRFRRGVGIALTYYHRPTATTSSSGAVIKLNEDGFFDVFISRNEDGSGLTTQLSQIASEVLGVTPHDILFHCSGTDIVPAEVHVDTFSALAICGGAVQKACEQMRRQILTSAGRMLSVLPETLKIADGVLKAPNGQQVTIAQVANYALYTEGRQLMTTATWKAATNPKTFGVQGVEVELDMETGSTRILKVVTALDIGKAINPQLLESSIEGNVAQALGLGISEELLYGETGEMLTADLYSYHLLTAEEMPQLETYLIENGGGVDLFGAKSSALVPLFGVVPALANAIMDAASIRIRHTPITPERTLRAIHALMAKR